MYGGRWLRLADGGLHDVDDNSSEGDIEPDGEGVTGEAAMGGESSGEREEEGDEDHWKRNDGEDDVRGEELPVEGPPGAEAVEFGFAVKGEVNEVGDEED